MGLDDGSTDRQPHAQPGDFGGDERLEDALEVDVLHAGTAVAHRDLDGARMMLGGLDAEKSLPGRAIGHGFRGVEQDVEDDLLELDGVAEHPRQVLRQREVHADALRLQLAAQQHHHLHDERVDVRRLVFRRLLAEQRPQPANDLGCPLGVGSDIGQRLPELSLIGGSTREHQASRLGVGGDRGQWLVDLVGQRACQRPQRRGAQGVGELVALALCLGLRPPPPRDIHVQDDGATLETLKRLHGHLEPPLLGARAGRVLQGRLGARAVEDGANGVGHCACADVARSLAGLEVVRADWGARRVPATGRELGPRRVDGDDHSVLVERRDVPVQRAEDGAVKREAFEPCRVGDFGLRHVGAPADVAAERAISREPRDAMIQEPAIRAVPAAQAVLHRERLARIERPLIAVEATLAVVGMHARRPPVAQLLLHRPPRELEPGVIAVRAAPVDAGHPHHDRRGIGGEPESHLALPDGVARAPADEGVGEDVAQEPQPGDQRVRPLTLGPDGCERDATDDHVPDFQRDAHQRARAQLLKGRTVGRRVVGKVLG